MAERSVDNNITAAAAASPDDAHRKKQPTAPPQNDATTYEKRTTANLPHIFDAFSSNNSDAGAGAATPFDNSSRIHPPHQPADDSSSDFDLSTPSTTAITTTVVESNTALSDFDLVGGVGDEQHLIMNQQNPSATVEVENASSSSAHATHRDSSPKPLDAAEKSKSTTTTNSAGATELPQGDLFKLVLSALTKDDTGPAKSSLAAETPTPPPTPAAAFVSSSWGVGPPLRNRPNSAAARQQQQSPQTTSLFLNDKISKKPREKSASRRAAAAPVSSKNGYGSESESDFETTTEPTTKSFAVPTISSSTSFFDNMMNFNLGQFLHHIVYWQNPAFSALVLLSGAAVYSVLTSVSAVSLMLYAAGLSSTALLLVDGWTRLIALYTGQRHVDNLLKDLLLVHFKQLDAQPLAQFIVVISRELNKLCVRTIQALATDWRLLLPCTMTCWTLASLLRDCAFLNVALVALVSVMTLPKAYALNQAHVDRMTAAVQRAVKNTPDALTRLSRSESKIEFLRGGSFLKILSGDNTATTIAKKAAGSSNSSSNNQSTSYSDSSLHSVRR